MNKQLINKYKPEFDHWLNGGKLQANFVYDQWVEAPKDIFSYNMVNFVLVIDDEYIEFRRALAEGKTIQLNEAEKFSDPKRGWVDLSCDSLGSSTNLFPVEYYRIKPDGPKFKVGDWVMEYNITTETPIGKGFVGNIQVTAENLDSINNNGFNKLWQPKPGEWCWFWDEHYTTAILAKFENISNGLFIEHHGNIFEYCEPFIGELPSNLKDK